MHQNVYISDVRKFSTCYHLFEPQDIFSLGLGPLLCRTVTGSGAWLGHQSQVPNLGFFRLISSPCCSLSTYCLCYSCYRFSVLKHFRHCHPHTDFTAQPPTCSIQHYRSLPSLLQFAVWMRSWHSQTRNSQHFIGHHRPQLSLLQFAIWKHSWHHVTHMLFKASSSSMVSFFPVTFLTTVMLLTALLSLSVSCAGLPKLWAHSSIVLRSVAAIHSISASVGYMCNC
jgi:hypothetical protein